MPRRPAKPKPSKTCVVCGRPFTWRKKWKDVWHEVRYCSERCRRVRTRKEKGDDQPI
ncbi:DUF2256 domain-containing protein [Stieleria varia]|uniref:DUF2256 domain-containing protein n=1 Tax=Stieleria varia TaxID=2528005 RepID=A0A5C6A5F2_9BACT|nr:hypothetical protein Pla52n_54360 [Stieleria varia]